MGGSMRLAVGWHVVGGADQQVTNRLYEVEASGEASRLDQGPSGS